MANTRKNGSTKQGNARFGKDQPQHFCGKKGRSGPPKNNRNAMRHGLRAGMLPVGCKYIEIRLNAFRRTLEDAVIAAKGNVSLCDAAAIQTCLRWERHGMLAQRWLRLEGDKLKLTERLTFSREIARAGTERDKALSVLDLDAPPPSPWTTIDAEHEDNSNGHD